MTTVNVRLSAALAQAVASPRLTVTLRDDPAGAATVGATVGALLDDLAASYPLLAPRIRHVIVSVAGRHVDHGEPLAEGQEVVIVLPSAGGAARTGVGIVPQ